MDSPHISAISQCLEEKDDPFSITFWLIKSNHTASALGTCNIFETLIIDLELTYFLQEILLVIPAIEAGVGCATFRFIIYSWKLFILYNFWFDNELCFESSFHWLHLLYWYRDLKSHIIWLIFTIVINVKYDDRCDISLLKDMSSKYSKALVKTFPHTQPIKVVERVKGVI
jgi:hypothetical protein